MTARTHDVIAFASLLTFACLYPPSELNISTVSAAIVGNIVGSLIPDIDQATNRLWDLLPAGDYMGRIFHRVFLGHRTLTHSLLGLYLVHLVLTAILPKLFNPDFIYINVLHISIMIGYISHLVADSFTKDGLPLLFPLRWKFGFPPFSFLRITTGKWVENIVIMPGTIIYIFWFINTRRTELVNILSLIRK